LILAWAVLLGFLLALVRYRKNTLKHLAEIPMKQAWLILAALVLQIPFLRAPQAPLDQLRFQQVLFLASFGVLILFVGLNWRLLGALVLGAGLVLNLLVILANGGAMPISPETLVKINPGSQPADWMEGQHYHGSKDVILNEEGTRYQQLSDIYAWTSSFPGRAAYSLGDFVIAAGLILIMQGFATPVKKFSKGDFHAT
jgi:hypothetical protein